MAIGRSAPVGSFVFRGCRRPDGSVGTRNYVVVLPTVACANDVAERIAEAHPAARPLLHHQGCGQLQPDFRLIERTLNGRAGLEPQALTGLVAGGAQVLVFGTGRGAPQGFSLTPVVKYGEAIGEATWTIPVGTHVHIQNVRSRRLRPRESPRKT